MTTTIERPEGALAFTPVLDHGWVALVDVMPNDGPCGGDLAIVNAARTSFVQESQTMGTYEERLIRFLMRGGPEGTPPKAGHGSCFEHVVYKFMARVPVFVERQHFRHRMASYNSESGRYSELKDEYHVPAVDHCRTQVGKPGSYSFEQMDAEAALTARSIIAACNDSAHTAYKALLDLGLAKELARGVLPFNQFTTFMWTVNLRSLLNFLMLRNDSHAQQEIQEYARAFESIAEMFCPVAFEAFNECGRRAP